MRESIQMLQYIALAITGFVLMGVIVYFAGGYYRDFSKIPAAPIKPGDLDGPRGPRVAPVPRF